MANAVDLHSLGESSIVGKAPASRLAAPGFIPGLDQILLF